MSVPSLARRMGVLTIAAAALLGAASCTPDTTSPGTGTATTTTEAPAAKAILSPSAGPAGSFVDVAPPNDECDPGGPLDYSTLQAALTVPVTGIVLSQANQFIGQTMSTYATDDALVHLHVPANTPPGVYNVFLSCSSYLDTYTFSPAKFTVTAS